MLNVEMLTISKELAAVSEASADIRENIEYSSLIEKQSILKTSISKLDAEMKKADILDVEKISVDSVSVGTKVIFEDIEKGEMLDFTILGPWDADFESRILSYRSPIAIALMGHKIGEEVGIFIDNEERKFRIKSIKKYNES
jgi:transcription elongation GreA/GreB family factor